MWGNHFQFTFSYELWHSVQAFSACPGVRRIYPKRIDPKGRCIKKVRCSVEPDPPCAPWPPGSGPSREERECMSRWNAPFHPPTWFHQGQKTGGRQATSLPKEPYSVCVTPSHVSRIALVYSVGYRRVQLLLRRNGLKTVQALQGLSLPLCSKATIRLGYPLWKSSPRRSALAPGCNSNPWRFVDCVLWLSFTAVLDIPLALVYDCCGSAPG